MVQLVRSAGTVIFGVLCPILWLGLGDEFAEDIHVDALCDIVLTGMYPVAVRILTTELGIATLRGNQEGLDIPLKALFTFVHHESSCLSSFCFVGLAL